MALSGSFNGDADQTGQGSTSSAFGKSTPSFGKPKGSFGKSAGSKIVKTAANPFSHDGAGKLSKSASTRSESLARLRGKGAIS